MGQPDSSVTPEKRLLKLIEQPESGKKDEKSKLSEVQRLLSPGAIKGYVGLIREWIMAFAKKNKVMNMRFLNRVIAVFVIFLGVYLTSKLLFEGATIDRQLKSISEVPQKEHSDAVVAPIHTFGQEDLSAAEKRNIFTPVKKKAEQAEEAKSPVKLVEMIKDYKLTGISVDPEDPARTFCMIEDLKKNFTSFLKKGDTIAGMKIEDIGSDEVTLSFDKEKIQLR